MSRNPLAIALLILVVHPLLLAIKLLPAEEFALEQIISREDPAFHCDRARLAVGSDGQVYIASGGTPSYVLRVDRTGNNKLGSKAGYALTAVAANDAGVIATANAHFSHKVVLYGNSFEGVASVEDFLVNDQVGWNAPGHVEAGAIDFFGLDQHRQRIVRLSPQGKVLKSYAYPIDPRAPKDQVRDFRVDEKRETLYLLAQSGTIRCVSFGGLPRWQVKSDVRSGDHYSKSGGFDIDEDGVLFTLGSRAEIVNRYSADVGKLLDPIALAIDDIKAELVDRGFYDLRVANGQLYIHRKHPFELYRRHSASDGSLQQVVNMDHERLTANSPSDLWLAGSTIPFEIHLQSTQTVSAPKWRVWGRTAGARDFREFPLVDNKLQVPTECVGLFQVYVTPDVLPGHSGSVGDYRLQNWVEIRQSHSIGTANVYTLENRTHYGRGESVPFSVAVRMPVADKLVAVTVRLMHNGRNLAEGIADVKSNGASATFVLPAGLTAALLPGDYLLTTTAAGLTCVPQPLTIGHGIEKSTFRRVQYGDYGTTYPQADMWNVADVAAGHAERTRKLGFNLLVDRLGDPNQGGALKNDRWRSSLQPIQRRLEADLAGVAPQKAILSTPLQQTLSAYGAHGIEQMAILMMNDAGLPLGGPGFDPRKPDQLLEKLTEATTALRPYPAFRGWSWASNWWVFQNRGSVAAKSPEEQAAYLAAEKIALETGKWDSVLDRVSGYRLNYAVDAQALFNEKLREIAPNLVTAVASPYRNVESYPPVSLGNVDEVDLQAQWEQVAVPYHAAHSVDYYKRPGKPAWIHPEVWNDAGTGDQIVPTLFQALMRGADGVGASGAIPSWSQHAGGIPADPRLSHQGMTSIYRSLNEMLRQYGPWLTTLENNDRVAIVVSGRMMRTDAWRNVMGTYFARIFEAYCSCLHAHHPAKILFAEDMQSDSLTTFEAVLVVGQRVELEPNLADALSRANAKGVSIFRDGTCRDGLVPMSKPLDVSFDKFEQDAHPASDDAAYWRFADYCKANRLPLMTALNDANIQQPAATKNSEVFLTERRGKEGRFLFVVNNTTPQLEPGHLWRMSLCVATRIPVVAPITVEKTSDTTSDAIYDVFAGKRVELVDGVFEADLRHLSGRIFAILPQAIERVAIRGPVGLAAGKEFSWSVKIHDSAGQEVPASVPIRVLLRDVQGRVMSEQFAAVTPGGLNGTFTAPLNAVGPQLFLEATELLSGISSTIASDYHSTHLPTALAATGSNELPRRVPIPVRGDPVRPISADALGKPSKSTWKSADRGFGPHVRDITLSDDGSLAVLNTMELNENLYGVDTKTGAIRWRKRVGNYFAFAPQPLENGIAIQGFDFNSAEGYHLYLTGSDGESERRFALYGLPKRLPHKFVPAMLNDRINNFAVPPKGDWVATAGDLGLAVWSRAGELLWSQDWWKTKRHTATLTALDSNRLLATEGLRTTAYDARSGQLLWQVAFATTGDIRDVRASADGKTVAASTTTDGGRVFILRDGKIIAKLPTAANEISVNRDGSSIAVTVGRQLKFYSTSGVLQWILPADDTLHSPRFASDGRRLAVASELGTLYVVDRDGTVLLKKDTENFAEPSWLPNGDLLIGTWAGNLSRLDSNYKTVWTTNLRSTTTNLQSALLAKDVTPTVRMENWGNAEAEPWPLSANLLDPQSVLIKMRAQAPHIQLRHSAAVLVDGKSEAPPSPWLAWGDVGNFAETSPFNYLLIDTYRTRLRVTGITLVEDAEHPESWLRDTQLESWDPAGEKWLPVQQLLSNAAVHTHKLTTPLEASRFRLVLPWGLYGNLRLGEIVLHGEKIGPSHPDAAAGRPVAVLFDESDELKDSLVGNYHGTSFLFESAFHGGRCIKQDADRYAAPLYVPPFGHVIPTWDFEIVENPGPGQYRYAQFAWRALSPETRGLMLQFEGDAYGSHRRYFSGQHKAEDGTVAKKIGDSVSQEWQVVRVDLWALLQKPTRIRGLRFSTTGGPATFDQILLGRAMDNLPQAKK